MSNKIYKACIYARLSRDDGDKLESDSITNQKALIRDFLSKHPEIHVVSEKTDDGYSGVNFDLDEIVQEKIKINEEKYPVEKSKGNSKKYYKL